MEHSHNLFAAKVDSRDRIHIPKKIKEFLFVEPEDIIIFEIRNADVIIYRLDSKSVSLVNRAY